uniref:Uncharacterized protein n=1 Tax=Onchocerca volvulus TaxID=6282 RepID=A0A8R1TUD2_ONCVO
MSLSRYSRYARTSVHACLAVTLTNSHINRHTHIHTYRERKERERKTKRACLPLLFLPLTAYNRLPFRKKFAIKEAAMSICSKMQLVLNLLSFNRHIDMHAARCIALSCADIRFLLIHYLNHFEGQHATSGTKIVLAILEEREKEGWTHPPSPCKVWRVEALGEEEEKGRNGVLKDDDDAESAFKRRGGQQRE